jgi:hypothetical protein
MRNLVAIVFGLSLALTAACGGDDASCEKVVDHTLSLMPDDMKAQLGSDKKPLIEQCEKKTSKEERKCALDAKSLEDLAKCRGK